MFLKPSKPCKTIKTKYQNSETKTKTEATNLKLNQSNLYEKENQSRSNHQTHMRPKPNQTHQIHMKPKPIQNHQTDQSIKCKSYSSPILTLPSTTEFSYQTHRRSTHPPPLSSQAKKLKH